MSEAPLGPLSLEKKFSTPEEELAFLRERVARLEEDEAVRGIEGHEGGAHAVIEAYAASEPAHILEEATLLPEAHAEAVVLALAPEKHDAKMSALIEIVRVKGIKNALSVVEKMRNSHVRDDFHRYLVEYVKEGYETPGLKEKSDLWKRLHMTMFEVALPDVHKDDAQKELKHLISAMEQFYAGMRSISGEKAKDKNHFAIEIAQPDATEEISFHVAVPDSRADLFEKHMLAVYPGARVIPMPDDYNVFNEEGCVAAATGSLSASPVYPLKIYDEFDNDPLSVVLNSFSKLSKHGEGAAVQLVLKPTDDVLFKRFKSSVERIRKGVPVKEATDLPTTISGEVRKTVKELFFSKAKKLPKPDEPRRDDPIDEDAIEKIQAKLASPMFSANLRLIASAPEQSRADSILDELRSAYHQFERAGSNSLVLKRVSGRKSDGIAQAFTWRTFDEHASFPLSIRELTTIIHFPSAVIKTAPALKRAKAGTAPAPLTMGAEGILLGRNVHRGQSRDVFFSPDDRLRHFYVIGQTGTGKSTLLKNMVVQDIQRGEGVCYMDPHGTDIEDVLGSIPPERADDVIYFDPSFTARPMALNMLEYDRARPEQKTFVVNELFSIFQKLYGAVPESMGPMFEQYFRNATLLVIEDPDTGSTLLDVSRVMADAEFRRLKLSRCGNPVVVQFWREVAQKAGGEASLANMVPYITSKFDVFLANEIMRPIIAQERSNLNLRDIMDGRKILLVNLAKGRLGDLNANLIGLIIVGKILMAALSRVDRIGSEQPPFYLYIDEFQNVTTNSIAVILSEARKYKLALTVAHQFIAQLEERIRDAVFGNVGSIAAFRVGAEDTELLEKQFAPSFSADEIMNIDNRNAYVRLLVNGRPEKPFSIETLPPSIGNREQAERIKNMSYERHGRPRADIEREIAAKYASPIPGTPSTVAER